MVESSRAVRTREHLDKIAKKRHVMASYLEAHPGTPRTLLCVRTLERVPEMAFPDENHFSDG